MIFTKVTLKILTKYKEWKLRRMLRKVEKCCKWIETYARNTGMSRQQRKDVFKQYGKLVFGLTVGESLGVKTKSTKNLDI